MGQAFGRSRQEAARRAGAVLVPFLPKDGRLRPDPLPVEELVAAGPGMHLSIANPAIETARALVLMFLSCRGVIHPATGAGEFFGRPDAVGHISYPLAAVRFQPGTATPWSI